MTLDRIMEHVESNDGFCTICKKVTAFGGVEPDARNYECPECGQPEVFGMEEAAAVMMVVPLTEEEDDVESDE